MCTSDSEESHAELLIHLLMRKQFQLHCHILTLMWSLISLLPNVCYVCSNTGKKEQTETYKQVRFVQLSVSERLMPGSERLQGNETGTSIREWEVTLSLMHPCTHHLIWIPPRLSGQGRGEREGGTCNGYLDIYQQSRWDIHFHVFIFCLASSWGHSALHFSSEL